MLIALLPSSRRDVWWLVQSVTLLHNCRYNHNLEFDHDSYRAYFDLDLFL